MPGLQRIYSLPMAISEDPDRLLGEEKFFKTSLLYVFFFHLIFLVGWWQLVSIDLGGGPLPMAHTCSPPGQWILPLHRSCTNCRYIGIYS